MEKLGAVIFGGLMIAAGIWFFDPADSSRVCAKGACSSGAAVSLSVILMGSIFAFLGLQDLLKPLWFRKSRRKASPYGSASEYERRLREMGVPQDQISAQLKNQRDEA